MEGIIDNLLSENPELANNELIAEAFSDEPHLVDSICQIFPCVEDFQKLVDSIGGGIGGFFTPTADAPVAFPEPGAPLTPAQKEFLDRKGVRVLPDGTFGFHDLDGATDGAIGAPEG